MKLIRVTSLEAFPEADQALVLAVGAFDGLHLGHQAVIEDARTLAQSNDAQVAVLRFFPHPARFLRPEECPPLLCTEDQIEEGLNALGVNVHLRLPFTADLANLDAEAFLNSLTETLPGLSGIVVGPNWRFGKDGRGDIGLLQAYAEDGNFRVHISEGRNQGDSMISATRIRAAVSAGRLQEAAELLGSPFQLSGTVQEGKQLGRTLGFRTANFIPAQECLPPGGVYVTRVHIDGKQYKGAGYLRAIHDEAAPFPLAEVHLLDEEMDLYGKEIRIDLLEWLRPATPIPNVDALREQIKTDVRVIRERLANLSID